MAMHLAAFFGDAGVNELANLSPVVDTCLPSTARGFLMPSPLKIVAAAAGGVALLRARINAPSLLRLGYPFIRPANLGASGLEGPNVMNLTQKPLTLPASEELSVEAAVSEAGQVAAYLWLCDEITPVPPGEPFCMRFSFTGARSPTEWVWSSIGPIKFDQSLPPGTYAVIGFEHWAPTAYAARLAFPGAKTRPGVLSTPGADGFPPDVRMDAMFREGGLGVYGTFDAFAPPSLEVFGSGTYTTHEGYLTLVRVG